jgi:hypothetical protein
VATLPTNFRQALHNVQPAEDEKNAADAHDQVSDALTGDPKLRQLGIDPVLIGSYAREVSIKRVKTSTCSVGSPRPTPGLIPETPSTCSSGSSAGSLVRSAWSASTAR